MRRRMLVVAIAILGVAIVVAAGIVGVRVYGDAVRAAEPTPPTPGPSAATEAAYRSAISSWPFALPVGEALPRVPPSMVAGGDSVRPFLSTFFVCAWQRIYLQGPADGKPLALTNLVLWERLPASISSADNSDGVWTHDVIIPAIDGDDTAMWGLYTSDCIGDGYSRVVTTPEKGLVIDRPQAEVVSTASVLNPCANAPTTAPCDPAFGPNRTLDLGSRTGARGTVTLDGAGVPRAYLVAAGDSLAAITERFGGANIWGLNCYRRTDLNLYAGDTLNLDYYTVTTVGSENGSTVSKSTESAATCLTQSAMPPHQMTP